ncbi:MAG: methyltransferase domain-containing protein [Acidobacteria bacterium]|nr:methyltransferase domain-containing protein [Acidobacteriota bacterium]
MEKVTHSFTLLCLLFAVSMGLAWLTWWLFRLYEKNAHNEHNFFAGLNFSAEQLGRFRYSSLALVSLLALFLEMMMVRWISSEIRVFAYFKNLVLVACFLGFGLGCYLCRRRVQLLALIVPVLVLTLILKTPLSPIREIITALPQMLGGGTEIRIWGVPALPTSWLGTLLGMAVMVPLFSVVAMVFIPLGQVVGWCFETASAGVIAYTVNVFASLAGIAAYTLLCFLSQPPAAWMLVAGVFSLLAFWRQPKARSILAASFITCTLLLSLPDHKRATTYWSPYQKLDLRPNFEGGNLTSYTLNTNDSWYQQIVNLSPEFIHSHPDEFRARPAEWCAYNLPYKFYARPDSVLVLGSGMGNDVAAALRNGAGRVVAIEIDPLILRLGRRLHFEHPYDSPSVQTVVQDARSYIQNSRDHFDLIVFSLLDSHTTASHFSNIRIDNFVYTREALARARQLLKADGLFIVKFQVDTPWIVGRLQALMKSTFGQEAVEFQTETSRYDTGGRFFIAGSPRRVRRAMLDPKLASFIHDHAGISSQTASVTTDDWPYFYQHEPGLPLAVILVSVAVLMTFGWFLRRSGTGKQPVDLHFLLLGAGFMLLEAQIVSRMALLFGTTWVVNSIVISVLLCLIVVANILYQHFSGPPLKWAYGGLFFSLLFSFLLPIEILFFESLLLRILVSTIVLGLPVLFASTVFISSFARVHFRGSALGSNLFGALVGGLLESLSLWFGLRSLLILAMCLYLGSALALLRESSSRVPLGADAV